MRLADVVTLPVVESRRARDGRIVVVPITLSHDEDVLMAAVALQGKGAVVGAVTTVGMEDKQSYEASYEAKLGCRNRATCS